MTIERSIGWVGTISDELMDSGPRSFARHRLAKQEHLFAHRAALFYTPTDSIPASYVGRGPLDITLPVVPPDFTEFFEIAAYRIPRFWVDLIQRQTGMLRWRPICPARVSFRRFDYWMIREDHLCWGAKALLDALKVRTAGRRDGRLLHYFGAIVDDGPSFVDVSWDQEVIDHPRDARIQVSVSEA